jgi:hypothetical protein
LKNGVARFLGQGSRNIEGDAGDLSGARVVTTVIVNGVPRTAIEVVAGVKKYRCDREEGMCGRRWRAASLVRFASSPCSCTLGNLQGRGTVHPCHIHLFGCTSTHDQCLHRILSCRFGESLELVEQEWIVSEVNGYLEGRSGRAPQLEDMASIDPPEVVYDDGSGITAGNTVHWEGPRALETSRRSLHTH